MTRHERRARAAPLFIDDRPFTPDDLQHVQTISDSGKRADAGRNGRFGQRLSKAYSASDEPIARIRA
jgi:hypothetical protein